VVFEAGDPGKYVAGDTNLALDIFSRGPLR
jgi:hypothetical protein